MKANYILPIKTFPFPVEVNKFRPIENSKKMKYLFILKENLKN